MATLTQGNEFAYKLPLTLQRKACLTIKRNWHYIYFISLRTPEGSTTMIRVPRQFTCFLFAAFFINCAGMPMDTAKRGSLFGGTPQAPEGPDADMQKFMAGATLPANVTNRLNTPTAPGVGHHSNQPQSANPSQNNYGNSNKNELTRVENNVWRSGIPASQVFNMVARIISQDYILATVDRRNLSLQTDWDKFFLEGRLFRNRLSISVFPISPRQTELVVKNIVEYFAGNPNKPEDMSTAAWMPAADLTDEISRLVDSLNRQTAYLNQGRLN